MDNRFLPLYSICVFSWALWAWELYKAHTHQPPQPTAVLCVAIVATGVCAVVFGRLLGRFRNLNRGERGEMRVAEVLDELRGAGYQVVHGIVGAGFDVDHVIVGPAGVFAIETKFRSGRGEIEFRNGEGLFVAGRKEAKDPIVQARGNAAHVAGLIKELCRINQWVKPIVVFVGDWKIKNKWQATDARVFTTDGLLRYIEDQQPELTRGEIKLIASHLDRSTRS